MLGMSGGVDSSAAAALLKAQGFDLVGVTLKLWPQDCVNRAEDKCCGPEAVKDARAVAPSRTVSLQVLDGPGIPQVFGDEARLRQVLGNLVANAVQHTPEDARIIVRVGTAGDDAVWEVVDEGQGMDPADAQRVFERFYRADASRARSSGGTGLGLSIVDSLVRAHGGRVSVTTAPGKGCCFRVSLPRVPEANPVNPVAPVPL